MTGNLGTESDVYQFGRPVRPRYVVSMATRHIVQNSPGMKGRVSFFSRWSQFGVFLSSFSCICHNLRSSWVRLDLLVYKVYRTSRCPSWFYKRQRNQRSSCQHLLDHRKSKRVPEKHLFLLYWLCQSLCLCGSQETVESSERDGNTRPPDLPLEKSVCRSGSNS